MGCEDCRRKRRDQPGLTVRVVHQPPPASRLLGVIYLGCIGALVWSIVRPPAKQII